MALVPSKPKLRPPVPEGMTLEEWRAQQPVPSGPQPSRGSDLHDGSGKCKPCVWYWKPGSCTNGADCSFCHMCPQGEHKERRKARVAQVKAQKKGEQEETPSQAIRLEVLSLAGLRHDGRTYPDVLSPETLLEGLRPYLVLTLGPSLSQVPSAQDVAGAAKWSTSLLHCGETELRVRAYHQQNPEKRTSDDPLLGEGTLPLDLDASEWHLDLALAGEQCGKLALKKTCVDGQAAAAKGSQIQVRRSSNAAPNGQSNLKVLVTGFRDTPTDLVYQHMADFGEIEYFEPDRQKTDGCVHVQYRSRESIDRALGQRSHIIGGKPCFVQRVGGASQRGNRTRRRDRSSSSNSADARRRRGRFGGDGLQIAPGYEYMNGVGAVPQSYPPPTAYPPYGYPPPPGSYGYPPPAYGHPPPGYGAPPPAYGHYGPYGPPPGPYGHYGPYGPPPAVGGPQPPAYGPPPAAGAYYYGAPPEHGGAHPGVYAGSYNGGEHGVFRALPGPNEAHLAYSEPRESPAAADKDSPSS